MVSCFKGFYCDGSAWWGLEALLGVISAEKNKRSQCYHKMKHKRESQQIYDIIHRWQCFILMNICHISITTELESILTISPEVEGLTFLKIMRHYLFFVTSDGEKELFLHVSDLIFIVKEAEVVKMPPRLNILTAVLLFVSVAVATENEEDDRRPTTSYIWKTGTWGSCYSAAGCGEGEQQRSIWCAHMDGRTTLEFLCDPHERPSRARSCFRVCEEHRGRLTWRVGVWGHCLPVDTDGLDISEELTCKDRIGAMNRDVECNYRRHAGDHPKTVDDDACEHFKSKPKNRLSCQPGSNYSRMEGLNCSRVPCPQNCVVAPFKKWLPCIGCGIGNRTRIRDVLVAPLHGGRLCPPLSETEGCREAVACLQSPQSSWEHKLWMSDWSNCLPIEPPPRVTRSPFSLRATLGYQTREIACRDPSGIPVDMSHCNYGDKMNLPFKVRTCVVPSNCVVSSWSEWTVVADGCITSGNDVRPELRKRTRRVLQVPVGDGKACPHLEELHRVTEKGQLQPCTKYKWVPSEWGECILTNMTTITAISCGGGIQLRTLTCLRSDVLYEILSGLVPVPQSYCSEAPPSTVQRCSVSCKRNCVVSPWSSWESCRPLDCRDLLNPQKIGYRKRHRSVLQSPTPDGDNCPPQVQVDICDQPTCYHWKTTEFNPCIVLNKELRCGQGRQTRKAYCVDLQGIKVDDGFCGMYSLEPEIAVPCYIPCPSDCVLSKWSDWTPCSKICTERDDHGLRTRNRTILAPAGLGTTKSGTPCPNSDELTETEICNHHSCFGFGWKTFLWQECKVTNPLEPCGIGEQIREVWCMKDEDRRVADRKCLPIAKPKERRACNVACPKDCLATKYTDWTVCPDSCHTVGRTRFRSLTMARTFLDYEAMMFRLGSTRGLKEDTTICTFGTMHRPLTNGSFVHESLNSTTHVVIAVPGYILLLFAVHGTVATQTRQLFILQHPQKGRDQCPEALKETRSCPTPCVRNDDDNSNSASVESNILKNQNLPQMCERPCYTFKWSLAEWGSCRLPDTVECGVGYRTRGVFCVRNDGKDVETDLCIGSTSDSLPIITERCHVSCGHLCAHSDWSEWSQCPQNCGGFQMRKRQLLDESMDTNECRNAQLFPLDERQSCPCHVYSAKPEGEWSDCILDGGDELIPVNGMMVRGRCGVGNRFRKVACYDKNGNLVDPLLCTPTGYEEDVCMIPCPVDCVMSAWSDWSACSAFCGSGIKDRSRTAIREAYDQGRPCPKLDTGKTEKEVKSCYISCEKYQWFAYGWTQCELSRVDWGQHCGTGIQNRKVMCMRVDNVTTPETIRDEYCDPRLKPINMNYCHVPCPMDCVVSDWSEWSICTQPCDSRHTRKRVREMVRESHDSGDPCPVTAEVEPCILNENCFHYLWNTSDWSSCILHNNATCGEGVRHRQIVCLRSDGRTVNDRFCEEMNLSRPQSAESWCSVDCPIDCVVSEWSDWNHSECGTCGMSGHAVRARQILVRASETGRPCPSALTQQKPCRARPCYHWVRPVFEKCDLGGADCGHGTSRRTVACRRGDGTFVKKKYCLEANSTGFTPWMDERWLHSLLDIHEEEKCHSPCPGDCVLSLWSEWSPCHRDCEAGEQGGIQTRSRAILIHPSPLGERCPEQLWKVRPCFGGPCFKYDWKIKNDEVTCLRSDGVVVQGGCYGRPRPCLPPCRVAHSECGTHGTCVCLAGFRPQFRESATRGRDLIGCELMQTANSSHHTAGGSGGEIKVIYLPISKQHLAVYLCRLRLMKRK
uniref:Spondin-like TSP1 domain-containing protein n=1 Tax=Strigamia maritima TaxID=126957 RepID=T1JAR7_STRMM